MDPMTLDLSQVLSNMPIAGAMIWFAYHITNESRKERQENAKASDLERKEWIESSEKERKEWSSERREIYEKIMTNLMKQNEYIEKNTETLKSLVEKKCEFKK